MFDLDRWNEIYLTLRKNPGRTILTGIGVGWGVFMLIIVLGAGSGLENGVRAEFAGTAPNSAFIWTMATSMPYKGFPRGRRFDMDNDDIAAMKAGLPDLEVLAPRAQLGGYRGSNNVSRNGVAGAFSVMGDYPEILRIQSHVVTAGRFINQIDIEDKRKVCVIGKSVYKQLYEKGEEPIGSDVKINGLYFKVVGVFESQRDGERAERDEQTIFIPLATYQKAFNQPDRVAWFAMLAREGASAEKLEQDAKALLASRHSVHPDDPRAFGSFNSTEEVDRINVVFFGIRLIGWLFGGLTLLAGAIGVSNIMLVIVRERTQEIGIRRALGATPGSIRVQIILESITLTTLAGFIGLLIGVGAIEGLSAIGVEGEMFSNPYVDVKWVLWSLVFLISAGVLAGLIPASRAVKINTIDALRAE